MNAGRHRLSSMTMTQFQQVFASGGFKVVGVTAAGAVFGITAVARSGEAVCLVSTRRRQMRLFRNPCAAMTVLYNLGVRKLEVDMSRLDPELFRSLLRQRPDVAARMRRVHGTGDLLV
jgi:hypothetical protein